MIRRQGYILIMLLLSLVIISTTVLLWMQSKTKENNNRQAKILATTTTAYVKIFGKYLNDVASGELYKMTGVGDECVKVSLLSGTYTNISLDDLGGQFGVLNSESSSYFKSRCHPTSGNYLDSLLTQTNIYNQTPCVGVYKSSSGEQQAFFFWAESDNSIDTPVSVAQLASFKIDGGAYLDDQESVSVIKSRAGWSLDISSPLFGNIAKCNASRLGKNSLIVNMQMYKEYNKQLNDELSLARESDYKYVLGNSHNRNTSKENIYMAYNGNTNNALVLNKDANVKMYMQNGKVYIDNGEVTSSSLRAYEEKEPGSECLPEEVGTKARQAMPPAGYESIQVENVVCAKSALLCGVYGYEYCWVPRRSTNFVYNNPKDENGNPVDSLICPAYSPTVTSASGGFDGVIGLYEPICYADGVGTVTGSQNCGSLQVNGHGTGTLVGVASTSPSSTRQLKVNLGTYIQSQVKLDSGVTYTINRGFKVNDATAECSAMCATITNYYPFHGSSSYKFINQIDVNNDKYCYCVSGVYSWYYGPSYAVKAEHGSYPYITSVTCSSKITVQGQ